MTLQDLVRDPDALWTREPPAEPAVLAALAAALPALPADYLAFLALSGGGEGDLGADPGWFALWPAGEVAALHVQYEIPTYLPGYTGFGSNGGGELLAFAPDGRVVAVPFIPMDSAEAVEIAPRFTDLVRLFGRGAPAT
ncbi:SMI1/KNR4 family protein [Roseisolibacter sp. H3M3-2]|uniref:SMI1/KNR4 family protein n=1 Tax=Roseisolibacter sp. H3M3-2 TaxID=3031323 RepID=UPI0023DB7C81|nr:SMI1/KNR4 family protein [Roseisolibacter sp. H3M3-2]MDF1501800.1 hypothetical protein [Roseisolibacter sp. H3M3-2]